MGGSCGVAVEAGAVRISYRRNGRWFADSIDAESAEWLLNGKLIDCGPFDDVVLTGRDTDVVESLLRSLDTRGVSTVRTVDEGAALLAYARSVDSLAGARSLLVLDLGGRGTSAFTLDVENGEVSRSVRRSALSGDGLDDIVGDIVMRKGVLPEPDTADVQASYRQFFTDLKVLLSTSRGVRAPNDGPMLITRAEFDDAVTPVILQLLAWAAPTDPDAVLLVGGGAQIPLVRTLVEQEWEVPVVLPDSPASVISEGAALEAVRRPAEMDIAGVVSDSRPSAETPAEWDLIVGEDSDTDGLTIVPREPDPHDNYSSAGVDETDAIEQVAFESDPTPLPSEAERWDDTAVGGAGEQVASNDLLGSVRTRVLAGGRRALGVVRSAPAVTAVIVLLVVLLSVVWIPVGSGPVEVVQVPTDTGIDTGSDSGFVPDVSSSEFPVESDQLDPPPPPEPSDQQTDAPVADGLDYPQVGFGSGTGLDVVN